MGPAIFLIIAPHQKSPSPTFDDHRPRKSRYNDFHLACKLT